MGRGRDVMKTENEWMCKYHQAHSDANVEYRNGAEARGARLHAAYVCSIMDETPRCTLTYTSGGSVWIPPCSGSNYNKQRQGDKHGLGWTQCATCLQSVIPWQGSTERSSVLAFPLSPQYRTTVSKHVPSELTKHVILLTQDWEQWLPFQNAFIQSGKQDDSLTTRHSITWCAVHCRCLL